MTKFAFIFQTGEDDHDEHSRTHPLRPGSDHEEVHGGAGQAPDRGGSGPTEQLFERCILPVTGGSDCTLSTKPNCKLGSDHILLMSQIKE